MKNLVWRNIGRFVLLMLVQLLVLNNVYLGSYVMPMLYLLFVLMLPTSLKRIPMLLIAFGTGLLVDIMTGALGFHALACTAVAMARILFADRILTRGEEVTVSVPSFYSVTLQYFVAYVLLLTALFYLVLFMAELFSFHGLWDMLLATVCSTLATTLLAVVYQWIFLKREKT